VHAPQITTTLNTKSRRGLSRISSPVNYQTWLEGAPGSRLLRVQTTSCPSLYLQAVSEILSRHQLRRPVSRKTPLDATKKRWPTLLFVANYLLVFLFIFADRQVRLKPPSILERCHPESLFEPTSEMAPV